MCNKKGKNNIFYLLDSFIDHGATDEVRTIVNLICNLSIECEDYLADFVSDHDCGVIEKLLRVLQFNHSTDSGTCRDKETELNVIRALGNIIEQTEMMAEPQQVSSTDDTDDEDNYQSRLTAYCVH